MGMRDFLGTAKGALRVGWKEWGLTKNASSCQPREGRLEASPSEMAKGGEQGEKTCAGRGVFGGVLVAITLPR